MLFLNPFSMEDLKTALKEIDTKECPISLEQINDLEKISCIFFSSNKKIHCSLYAEEAWNSFKEECRKNRKEVTNPVTNIDFSLEVLLNKKKGDDESISVAFERQIEAAQISFQKKKVILSLLEKEKFAAEEEIYGTIPGFDSLEKGTQHFYTKKEWLEKSIDEVSLSWMVFKYGKDENGWEAKELIFYKKQNPFFYAKPLTPSFIEKKIPGNFKLLEEKAGIIHHFVLTLFKKDNLLVIDKVPLEEAKILWKKTLFHNFPKEIPEKILCHGIQGSLSNFALSPLSIFKIPILNTQPLNIDAPNLYYLKVEDEEFILCFPGHGSWKVSAGLASVLLFHAKERYQSLSSLCSFFFEECDKLINNVQKARVLRMEFKNSLAIDSEALVQDLFAVHFLILTETQKNNTLLPKDFLNWIESLFKTYDWGLCNYAEGDLKVLLSRYEDVLSSFVETPLEAPIFLDGIKVFAEILRFFCYRQNNFLKKVEFFQNTVFPKLEEKFLNKECADILSDFLEMFLRYLNEAELPSGEVPLLRRIVENMDTFFAKIPWGYFGFFTEFSLRFARLRLENKEFFIGMASLDPFI